MPGGMDALLASPLEAAEVIVSGSSALVVDTVPTTDFRALKYFVSFHNITQDVAKYLEMNVVNENSSVSDSLSGKLGSSIDVDTGAAISGSNLELTITNNETYDVTVSLAKITFGGG